MYSRRLGRSFVAALLAAVCSMAVAGTVHAELVKCKGAIIKASATFAQAKAKALQKCEDAVARGKLPQSTDCSGEAKASAAVAKAATKLTTDIDEACGGGDKLCGGDTTGEDSGSAIGFPATCPNFENGSCTNPVSAANCIGIATCLLCIDEAAVDQAIGLSYDALVTTDPKDKAQKVLNKCQATIGKATLGFLTAKSKALAKCWDAVNKGKGNAPCPVPGDGKAAAAITNAVTKLADTIKKACAGKDKILGGTGEDADFTPSQIGFPATCMNVDPPGTEGPCGGAVNDLQGIITCLACVNEFKVDCADRAAAATLATYPSQCNPGPAVTPTPTPTPGSGGPTPTATRTPHCPVVAVEVLGDAGSSRVLDSGWTGLGHNATVISDGKLTFTISNCDNATRPCGECDVGGPIQNLRPDQGDINARRCSTNTAIKCSKSADCTTGAGTCEFFFGAPLPLSAGSIGTCITNQVNGTVSGTANVESGAFGWSINLTSRVFSSPDPYVPCPLCVGDATLNDGTLGGTCSGGSRNGQPCDANGTSPIPSFGTTSFDCPPAALISALNIGLVGSSGTETRTLSAQSPNCTSSFGGAIKKCFCSAAGGEPTKPNACIDDTTTPGTDESLCAPNSTNKGQCFAAPLERFCSPLETFRGCMATAECPATGDTCQLVPRPCFLDNGLVGGSVTAVGMADPPTNGTSEPTFAALFCIPPVAQPGVNAAAGLPGLGRLQLPLISKEILTLP